MVYLMTFPRDLVEIVADIDTKILCIVNDDLPRICDLRFASSFSGHVNDVPYAGLTYQAMGLSTLAYYKLDLVEK